MYEAGRRQTTERFSVPDEHILESHEMRMMRGGTTEILLLRDPLGRQIGKDQVLYKSGLTTRPASSSARGTVLR
jgi:hypothetical protein